MLDRERKHMQNTAAFRNKEKRERDREREQWTVSKKTLRFSVTVQKKTYNECIKTHVRAQISGRNKV